MFVLQSDITIGNFRFSGVNEVQITRSIHNYTDTAVIKLPSVAHVIDQGNIQPQEVTTGNQFNDGDKVTIILGYNGDMQVEFQGFVKRRGLERPLVVECEGYSWQLRRNNVKGTWKSISVATLLQYAIKDTDITVECDADMMLSNFIAADETGAAIIEKIMKETDGALSIFFIEPAKLWCGLVYTPYANNQDPFDKPNVQYRIGYNVVQDNDLKQRTLENNPVQINYSKKAGNGNIVTAQADPAIAALKKYKKLLNHIGSADDLKKLALEKKYRENYVGYEGKINPFLQPYALPGYKAYITDSRYPQLTGTYLVESTEVNFGVNGARRSLEIGVKIGFNNTSSK